MEEEEKDEEGVEGRKEGHGHQGCPGPKHQERQQNRPLGSGGEEVERHPGSQSSG